MFRFSIRDVLWLTVVVALGIGWWVEHSKRTLFVIDLSPETGNLKLRPGQSVHITANADGSFHAIPGKKSTSTDNHP